MAYDWSKNSDLLRKKISITEYVNKFVSLDRSGKGVCPFHDDHNPSMVVNESRGIFKCFSCGVGGDIIKFHSLKFSVNAKESMLALASEYHIDIDSFGDPLATPIDYSFTKYNDESAKFFEFRLRSHAMALDHVLKTRRLSLATLGAYGVGLCMNNQELNNVLRDKFPGVHIDQFKSLLWDSGQPIFGGRIIFPLYNRKGDHVLGFSGRKVYADFNEVKEILGFKDKPTDPSKEVVKYLNSPNDMVNEEGYNKSNYLYGYFIASAYGEINIVEGYYDVLSMYELDHKNTVAIGGTAFTSMHMYQLSSKNIVLALDFDDAGILATLGITKDYYYSCFQYGMFTSSNLDVPKDASDLLLASDPKYVVGNLYDYVEYIMDHLMDLRYDSKLRYTIYRAIADAVNATAVVSDENAFMASDIRLMMMRKLYLIEPELEVSLTEALEKIYNKAAALAEKGVV